MLAVLAGLLTIPAVAAPPDFTVAGPGEDGIVRVTILLGGLETVQFVTEVVLIFDPADPTADPDEETWLRVHAIDNCIDREPIPGTEELIASLEDIEVVEVFGSEADNCIDAAPITGDSAVPFVIRARGGNDEVFGGSGDDEIDGGTGDDILNGGPGDDTISGGPGNDLVRGDRGADILGGGGGWDVLDYSTDAGPGGIIVDLSGAPPGAGTDGWGDSDEIGNEVTTSFAAVRGKGTDDRIWGHRDLSTTIIGGGGDDQLVGGIRSDVIFGEGGADRILGTNPDFGLDDVGDFLFGGAGNDFIHGFAGGDTISGDGDPPPAWPPFGNDPVEPVDVFGRIPPQDIPDGGGSDHIIGGGGADTIYGGGGVDYIHGDCGWHTGGIPDPCPSGTPDGGDTIYGDFNYDLDGDGIDEQDITAGAPDWIRGGPGADTLVGGAGGDMLSGGDGSDLIRGNAGSDTIVGGETRITGEFDFWPGARVVGWPAPGMLLDLSYSDTVDYSRVQDADNPIQPNPAVTGEGVVLDLGPTVAGGGWASDGDVIPTIFGPMASTDIIFGIENVIGSVNDDFIRGSDEDRPEARPFNQGFDNILWGMAGDDIIFGMLGDDGLVGGPGNDTLWGDTGVEDAPGGNDELWGAGGDDILRGEAGDDILRGGTGRDWISGGAGIDVLDYSTEEQGVVVNLRAGAIDLDVLGEGLTDEFLLPFDPRALAPLPGGIELPVSPGFPGGPPCDPGTVQCAHTATDGGDPFAGIPRALDTLISTDFDRLEIVWGSSSADVIAGDDARSTTLLGRVGNDMLFGGSGNDHLDGGSGNDFLEGGLGDDMIIGGGTASLVLGGGHPDNLPTDNPPPFAGDYAGYTFILNPQAAGGVTVSLTNSAPQNTSAAGWDTITGIHNIIGSPHDDVLRGDAGPNIIRAGAGNDLLEGRGDADVFLNNRLRLTSDILDGGPGVDTSDYRRGVPGRVDVDLAAGLAHNDGEEGRDVLISIENALLPDNALRATAGPDKIISPGGSAILNGAASGGDGNYKFVWNTELPIFPVPGVAECDQVVPGISNRCIAQPFASPEDTTTYRLTVTDGTGRSASDFVVVKVSTDLFVDAGPDRSINLGDSVQLAGTASGGVTPYTISWDPPLGLSATNILIPFASPNVTTTYTLTVTDTLGKSVSDIVTVTVSDPFFVIAGADVIIAVGESTTLSASVTGGAQPLTFQWTPAEGLSATDVANPTATPTSTTMYTVTVTDANGRVTTGATLVTVAQPGEQIVGPPRPNGTAGPPPPQSSPPDTTPPSGSFFLPACGSGIGAGLVLLNLALLAVMFRRRRWL